ncbi:hypothetical protein ACS0TY_028252 [Phlomoides rotata]
MHDFYARARSAVNTEETSKRRPFFSTQEELYDEDYFDEQLPEKKRRLTPDQVHLLEKSFEAENKLEPDRKTQLAKKLNLQPRQVAVWFQNRRARWKTKQLERDYDQLKSTYDSLLSNYDSILKENDKLKTEFDVAFCVEPYSSNFGIPKQLLSLTEKTKEPAGEPSEKPDPQPPDAPPCLQLSVKVEDRLSTGSDGSAVVDDDGPQLLDSGDSYFPNNDYSSCMAAVDGINSEEDDGSDDGRGYFSDVFAVAEQQEPIGWCIWS